MKKYRIIILAIIILAILLPEAALGECFHPSVSRSYYVERKATCSEYGVKYECCLFCGWIDWGNPIRIDKTDHHFDSFTVKKEATCKEPGIMVYTCKDCGYQKEEEIPRTKTHNYGEWTVTKSATCLEEGTKIRSCKDCGETETATIAKGDHDWYTVDTSIDYQEDSDIDRWIQSGKMSPGNKYRVCRNCGKIEKTGSGSHTHTWGEWTVTKKATCKENGTRTRTCTSCGKKETESIPKSTAHKFGDWEVVKEATCTKGGKEKCYCKLCGASKTRDIEKLGHSFSDFRIIVEATDCSKGKRSSVCERCGKTIEEEFYPEGTLYKGGDNPPEAVKALQEALAELKLYNGKISGEYGNNTANAVSKFEKEYLGMKQDGIAWPKVLKALGLKRKQQTDGTGDGEDGSPVSTDSSKVKLLLSAELSSPLWDYEAGDTITISWTLTNVSKKDDAASVRLYQYKGLKSDKKKETEIAQPGLLAPGESKSGVCEYTVTQADVDAGRFTLGFIARCKYRKKDDTSNRIWFNLHPVTGEPEISPVDWTSDSGEDDGSQDAAADSRTGDGSGNETADSGDSSASNNGTNPEAGRSQNADPAAASGTGCVNWIVTEGSGASEYYIIVCEDHAGTAKGAKKLLDAREYGSACVLWDAEIDRIYTEWITQADSEGARNATEEKAAFENQLKSLEASLRLICTEEEVGAIVLEERMNHCVRLCGDRHASPGANSGQKPSVQAAAPDEKAGRTCSHQVIWQEDGSAHVVNMQCESHLAITQRISGLLASAGSTEEIVSAYRRAREYWMLELNTMYDQWYLSADESRRATITADRISFERLVEVREKTLADLYPDDPAFAAEELTRMVMERAGMICRVLHAAGILKN